MTRRVVIKRGFTAYPEGKKRVFTAGERVSFEDGFAASLIAKGFASCDGTETEEEDTSSRSVFSRKSQRLNPSGS